LKVKETMYEDDANAVYINDANTVYIHDEMKNGFKRVNNILVIMTLLFVFTVVLLVCGFFMVHVLQKSADFIIQTQQTQLFHYMG